MCLKVFQVIMHLVCQHIPFMSSQYLSVLLGDFESHRSVSLHLLGVSIHHYGLSNIITVPLWVIFHYLLWLLHHHGASHFNMVNFEKQCYIFLDPSENLIKALGLLPQKSTQHVSSNSGWFTGPGWEQVHWIRVPKTIQEVEGAEGSLNTILCPIRLAQVWKAGPYGNFWGS